MIQQLSRKQFLQLFQATWNMGEHVTLIGTTGSGKTYLAEDLYLLRQWVVVIATKSKDETLDGYDTSFYKIKKWPPDWYQRRVLFWKKPDELGNFSDQREAIYNVLSNIYKYGGRTVGLDDVYYISATLKMKGELQMLYTQARSQDISLVGNIQRPSWVPLEVTNQATHVMLFGIKDDKDIERVAQAQGMKKSVLENAIALLEEYEFIWVRMNKDPIIIKNDKEED